MTGNQRLFDSLVAFENYPWDNRAEAPELEISDIGDVMATVYPLTITVRQSPILSLQLIYDNAQFTETMIEQIGAHFRMLLNTFLKSDPSLPDLLAGPLMNCNPPWSDRNTDFPDTGYTTNKLHGKAPLEDINLHNPTEASLINIWQEVLGVPYIDMKDNFFESGGHSLAVVQLFTKVEETFGKRLPLATLFEAPTIEQMAALLQHRAWAPAWSSLVAIQPKGSNAPFF